MTDEGVRIRLQRNLRLANLRLTLGAEELAPALRVDRAVDDLAGVRRLELDAAVAFLSAVRMVLRLGVGLADFLLRVSMTRRDMVWRRIFCSLIIGSIGWAEIQALFDWHCETGTPKIAAACTPRIVSRSVAAMSSDRTCRTQSIMAMSYG